MGVFLSNMWAFWMLLMPLSIINDKMHIEIPLLLSHEYVFRKECIQISCSLGDVVHNPCLISCW